MRCERNLQLLFILPIIFISVLWNTHSFVFVQATSTSDSVTITGTVPGCGDGVIQTGEECDGSKLNGQTCVSRGFTGGTLACKSDCTFDTSQCTSAPSGGGGGGGGVYIPPVPQTIVNFSGRAYPKSAVTLLKDAQVAATTVAGSDANFQMSLSGLSAGNYIFSVYSEDSEGRRSSLVTFPVSVTQGTTTNVSGIFIAPTIDVDKEEVKRGENIAILGQSTPKADIIISVKSDEEYFGKTISDKDGIYLYNFDTTVLDYGTHYTKSKASIANLEVSSFSHAISFKVSTTTVPKEKKPEVLKGDVNADNRVNLVDFSITAYWYKRPSPPASVDLNSDGKVDLVDFSIMAYYWTG